MKYRDGCSGPKFGACLAAVLKMSAAAPLYLVVLRQVAAEADVRLAMSRA